MRKIILTILIMLWCSGAWAVTKVGIFTDAHYDDTDNPLRLTVAEDTKDIFVSENVDLILALGDLYDEHDSVENAQSQIVNYEAIWAETAIPKKFVIGNHDISGGLTATTYVENSSYCPSENWYYDIGDYRIISIYNVRDNTNHKFSAGTTNITYLENALESARVASKKIIVAIHGRIDQNWPGDTVSWLTEPTNETATLNNFSGTTGAITFNFTDSAITAGDVGDEIFIKHSTTWGSGTITDVTGNVCTIITTRNLGGTGNADNWTFSWFSGFAGDALEQRTVIDVAKGNGATIIAVVQGHNHVNAYAQVDDGNGGINYYSFPDMEDNGQSVILQINNDDSLDIAGIKGATSYNHLERYVNQSTGSDSNGGMLESDAWLTLTKAETSTDNDTGYADTVIYVRDGVYRETLTTSQIGTSGHPIKWIFDDNAIVSGANIITGFSGPDSNGEYTVALTTECKVVISDSVLLTEGTAGTLTDSQWDWVDSVLYLGFNPISHEIEAGQRSSVVQGSSQDYVEMDGINIYGGNVAGLNLAQTVNSFILSNVNIYYNVNGIQKNDNSALNTIIIKSGRLYNNKNNGIYLSGSTNLTVRNCLIYDNILSGLYISATSNAQIINVTSLSNNRGVYVTSSGTVNIKNSIFWGNITSDVVGTVAATNTAISYSIVGTNSYGGIALGESILTSDPLLDPTTFFPLSTSPAMGQGECPFVDGDGDQQDMAGNLIWSDTTDAPVGPGADGWEIGAYQRYQAYMLHNQD